MEEVEEVEEVEELEEVEEVEEVESEWVLFETPSKCEFILFYLKCLPEYGIKSY